MLFGYDPDELISKNVTILMNEEHARNHSAYMDRYLAKRAKAALDSTRRVDAVKKDKTTFPVEMLLHDFRKSSSDLNFVAFFRNVEADINLQRISDLSEAVLQMIPVPLILTNRHGNILRANWAALQDFSSTPTKGRCKARTSRSSFRSNTSPPTRKKWKSTNGQKRR